MEGKEDHKSEGKDSKHDDVASAWINPSGLIVECNEAFCQLLDSSASKLIRQVNVTEITKFENPSLLLESVHELDELFSTSATQSKTTWKAPLNPTHMTQDPTIAKEEEYYIVINKPSRPDELRRVGHQILLPARLLPASEVTSAHHRSRVDSTRKSAADIAALTASLTSSKPHKVLVVDDSPTALKVMGHLIKRLGHEVIMATDGLEALDMLRTQTFDIVLMDINMPKMNGLQAAHEFRKIEEERNRLYGMKNPSYLKVIAMSGDISNTLFHEVTNAGFDTFIPKPLTQEKFNEVLTMKIPSDHHHAHHVSRK